MVRDKHSDQMRWTRAAYLNMLLDPNRTEDYPRAGSPGDTSPAGARRSNRTHDNQVRQPTGMRLIDP